MSGWLATQAVNGLTFAAIAPHFNQDGVLELLEPTYDNLAPHTFAFRPPYAEMPFRSFPQRILEELL
jgi:hypothetical protein